MSAVPDLPGERTHYAQQKERENHLQFVAQWVRRLLEACGENVERSGLKDTPMRVAKMYVDELFCGLSSDLEEIVNSAIFEEGSNEMVIVSNIPFYSMCEHHLIPFHGTAAVGYIPLGGRVVGLSKIARVVDLAARQPQVQERLTAMVADALWNSQLQPEGVGVVMSAEHLCMSMRGIQRPGSVTTTSAVRGSFKDEPGTRAEWMTLLGHTR